MQLELEFGLELRSAKINEKRWQLANGDRGQFEPVERANAVETRVQLWSVEQRVTESEYSLTGNV
jgi:hypothetical protein